jgi:hypothetical protein
LVVQARNRRFACAEDLGELSIGEAEVPGRGERRLCQHGLGIVGRSRARVRFHHMNEY